MSFDVLAVELIVQEVRKVLFERSSVWSRARVDGVDAMLSPQTYDGLKDVRRLAQ